MRTNAALALGLICAIGLVRAADDEKPAGPITHLDAPAAAKLLAEKEEKKRPVIIDIRTLREYEEGHLKGAKQIDFLGSEFEVQISKLDLKQPYLVHCRSGGRSSESLKLWKKLGFKKVYHLDGGILAWTKAKLPVEK